MTKNYESGRSMVEMLGTLAIIGVLSVGAIAGYSYGMDKYRANETINDVMLLGVDVITHASRTGGMPNLSAEWGTKTTVGYDFTVVPNPEDETQYGIRISGVPARVCKMVGDALKPMASVYVNDDEHITEEDPCDESDSNTMEFYFASASASTSPFGDECKTDTDCGTDKYCDNGWCFDGNRPEGTARIFDKTCLSPDECNIGYTGTCSICTNGFCTHNVNNDTSSCTLDNGTLGQCAGGECIAKGCTYDTNKCNTGYYCASPNTNARSAFSENEVGACIKTSSMFTRHNIGSDTYYVSKSVISWWDADAACKALGKNIKLLSVDELATDWDGGTGNYYTQTPLASSLRVLVSEPVWTSNKTTYEGNPWNTECYPFCIQANYIYLEDDGRSRIFQQSVHNGGHRHTQMFAICH